MFCPNCANPTIDIRNMDSKEKEEYCPQCLTRVILENPKIEYRTFITAVPSGEIYIIIEPTVSNSNKIERLVFNKLEDFIKHVKHTGLLYKPGSLGKWVTKEVFRVTELEKVE